MGERGLLAAAAGAPPGGPRPPPRPAAEWTWCCQRTCRSSAHPALWEAGVQAPGCLLCAARSGPDAAPALHRTPARPRRHAHDIGEALQIKMEQLPEIARAFVHLDYEFDHAPEHK